MIDGDGGVKYYMEKGILHRLDGPAVLEWESMKSHEAGEKPIIEAWYKDGFRHRIDGPASMIWCSAKSRKRHEPPYQVSWYANGKLHRVNGPAHVRWDTPHDRMAGKIPSHLVWFVDGRKHRLDGPAVIQNGVEQWWLNGIRYVSQSELLEVYLSNDKMVRKLHQLEEAVDSLLDRIRIL